MMDYYQQQAPQQGQQKQTKVAKSINTNVVLYLGELPPDVDQYELHQFIMGQGKFNVESLIVKPTKENKSFAYVKFKTKAEVERARQLLHLKSLRDYVVKAEPFRQKDSLKEESTKNKITQSSDSNLFVKNLPSGTTPKDLYELFSKYGDIISIKLRQNKKGECLGYGYVNYQSNSSAEEALKCLNDYEYQHRNLYVSLFSPKKDRSTSSQDKFPLVLIKQLPPTITTEKHLQEIFSKFGQIAFCGLVSNKETKEPQEVKEESFANETESKVAVVLFTNKDDAADAVSALNETTLDDCDTPLLLSLAPINKETIQKLWKAKQESYKTKYEGCNLVVKNIPKEVSERNLFEICKEFGDIAVARIATEGKMKVTKDDNGNVLDKEFVYESRGYGFVLFKNSEDARKAKEALNKPILFKNQNLSMIVEYYDYTKAEKTPNQSKGQKTFPENKSPTNKRKFNNNNNNNSYNNNNHYSKNFKGNNVNKNFKNPEQGMDDQTRIINNRTVVPPRNAMMNNKVNNHFNFILDASPE
jgi:polyadenylate-binding protein